MKNKIRYYQLLNKNIDELIEGCDNPAGIPDNTNLNTAKKMAREWMVQNGIAYAELWINECDGEGNDKIIDHRKIQI